jgi:hypothetical protein
VEHGEPIELTIGLKGISGCCACGMESVYVLDQSEEICIRKGVCISQLTLAVGFWPVVHKPRTLAKCSIYPCIHIHPTPWYSCLCLHKES